MTFFVYSKIEIYFKYFYTQHVNAKFNNIMRVLVTVFNLTYSHTAVTNYYIYLSGAIHFCSQNK